MLMLMLIIDSDVRHGELVLWRTCRLIPIQVACESPARECLLSLRAVGQVRSGRLPDLYLNRSRDVRPLPARLYRPCRSPQSLHCVLNMTVTGTRSRRFTARSPFRVFPLERTCSRLHPPPLAG